jgi:hypothetical protein
MSIKFEDDQIVNRFNVQQTKVFFISRIVIKLGITRSEKKADIISAIFLVSVIIVSSIIFYVRIKPEPTIDKPYSELTEEQKREIPIEIRMDIEDIERQNNIN